MISITVVKTNLLIIFLVYGYGHTQIPLMKNKPNYIYESKYCW